MTPEIPGWYLAGSHPHEYEHGVLEDQRHDGGCVGYLRCTADQRRGFGTMMQIVDALSYRGRRVRFSASVRSEDAQWAGLWMRVDEPNGQFSAFDNMKERQIKGTTGWTSHQVVLDVWEESAAIAFGILLGAGRVWFAGLAFDEVGQEVPTTGRGFPPRPQNLELSPG